MNNRLTADCHRVIASAIQGLDYLARQMEQTWGVGRLPLLVPTELRARFNQQIELMNASLQSDVASREEILAQVEGCKRAWKAVEAAALGAGCQPMPAAVWEAPNPDGGVFLIVRDNADASQIAIQAKERSCQVFTVEEIGRILARYPEIGCVKDSFPGAMVTSVRIKTQLETDLSDSIPF